MDERMSLAEDEVKYWTRYGAKTFSNMFALLRESDTHASGRQDKSDNVSATQLRKQLQLPQSVMGILDRRRVHGSLEEVAEFFVNDDAIVLDFSASRVVMTLQDPTPEQPLTRTELRWSLFKSPSKKIARSQDFFYITYMQPFVGAGGRRGWAKCSHSITLDSVCPPTPEYNRGKIYFCGTVFQETRHSNILDVTFFYNVDTTNIPSIVAPMIMKHRGKNNAELLDHFLTVLRAQDASTARESIIQRDLKARKHCSGCCSQLPSWRHKERCHFCDAYICKKCTTIIRQSYNFTSLGKRNACFQCAESKVDRVHAPDRTISDDTSSDDHEYESGRFYFQSDHRTIQPKQKGGKIFNVEDEDESSSRSRQSSSQSSGQEISASKGTTARAHSARTISQRPKAKRPQARSADNDVISLSRQSSRADGYESHPVGPSGRASPVVEEKTDLASTVRSDGDPRSSTLRKQVSDERSARRRRSKSSGNGFVLCNDAKNPSYQSIKEPSPAEKQVTPEVNGREKSDSSQLTGPAQAILASISARRRVKSKSSSVPPSEMHGVHLRSDMKHTSSKLNGSEEDRDESQGSDDTIRRPKPGELFDLSYLNNYKF